MFAGREYSTLKLTRCLKSQIQVLYYFLNINRNQIEVSRFAIYNIIFKICDETLVKTTNFIPIY